MKTSIVLTFLTSTILVLSFLSKVAIAYLFGAGWQLDSYLVALAIPAFMRLLFNDAAGLSIISAMNEIKNKYGAETLKKFKRTILTIVPFLACAIVALFIVNKKWIINILAPSISEKNFLLATNVFSILMISMVFSLISAILLYYNYFNNTFVLPSLVHFIPPISIIIFGFLLSGKIGIMSLAIGDLTGSIVQCLILTSMSLKIMKGTKELLYSNSDILKVIKNIPLIGLSLLPLPMIPIIDRHLASFLPDGSISYLGYSWPLTLAVASIISKGASTTFFPYLSEKVYTDFNKLQNTIVEGIRVFIYITIPLALIIIFVREPVVQLLLVRGKFTMADAAHVSNLLFWHMAGIIGIVLFNIINRVNCALKYFRLVAIIGVSFIIVYYFLSLNLMRYFRLQGIAMANACVWLFTAVVLVTLLYKRGVIKKLNPIINLLIKTIYSSIFVLLALKLTTYVVNDHSNLLSVILIVITGLLVYLLVSSYIFRIVIFQKLINKLFYTSKS